MRKSFQTKAKRKNPELDGMSPEEIEQMEIRRTVMPKGREVFGILEQRLGGSRNKVRCLDGKTRICRIPGRLKRKLWVREGDLLLVEPWELSGDEKGDIIYKYKPSQMMHLKRIGVLKSMDEFGEF
ncbi:MAG: translation initiation factor eIF-1A [Candidatus Woesearchaeota archaeon]|jgi:translation initiation factor 1A